MNIIEDDPLDYDRSELGLPGPAMALAMVAGVVILLGAWCAFLVWIFL